MQQAWNGPWAQPWSGSRSHPRHIRTPQARKGHGKAGTVPALRTERVRSWAAEQNIILK